MGLYRSKLSKILNVREERYREREINLKEIEEHDNEIMQEKFYLRSTVLSGQDNLNSSRLSLCVDKIRQADRTRDEKRQNMQEVRLFEDYSREKNRRRCESVKSSKMRTQQSVETFHFDKRMTINQRKLQ